MKIKLTIALVFGLAIGFCLRSLVLVPLSLNDHWRIVKAYRAYVLDPENYTSDSQTGLSVTEPPHDPMPSLAILVSAGELNHIDIVLPTVARNNK